MKNVYRITTCFSLCLVMGQVHAQTTPPESPVVAFPIYNAAHAMQGLHRHTLLPRAQAFSQAATALTTQTVAYCNGSTSLPVVRQQWKDTRQAWEALSSVATGAVLERRSQRQIDFWPVRPALVERAIARAPQGEAAMQLVGTPAKGLPALEWLLWTRPAAPATPPCTFAQEVAKDVEREAKELVQAETKIAAQDWEDDAEASGKGMAEWINQWLGALEQLRWAQMEKPLKAAPANERPAYARLASSSDAVSWQTQWQALRAQAGVTPEQRRAPPQPGQALVPIEAILMGKGELALATRWSVALAKADAAMVSADPARASTVLSATTALKTLNMLFQNEVASSLDIPLGFSSADGD
jgi:predicted lipoprotein